MFLGNGRQRGKLQHRNISSDIVFVPQLFMSMVVGECKYMRVVPEKLKILIDQEPWQPVDVYIYIFMYMHM